MRKFLLRIVPFEGEASTKDGRLEVLADHGYVLRTDGLRGPAFVGYELLEGGLLGDTLDEVLQFALIAFLHDRVTRLHLLINHEGR